MLAILFKIKFGPILRHKPHIANNDSYLNLRWHLAMPLQMPPWSFIETISYFKFFLVLFLIYQQSQLNERIMIFFFFLFFPINNKDC